MSCRESKLGEGEQINMPKKLVCECANRDRLKTDKNVFPAHVGKKYFNKNKEEVA